MTLLKSLGFFIYTLFVARWQQWEAVDIAWSMWISSLVIGGAYVFTSIICSKIFRQTALSAADISQLVGRKLPQQAAAVAAAQNQQTIKVPKGAKIGITIFLLVFFTIHFGGFHYGHSQFLISFFPLEELGGKPHFLQTIMTCMTLYWPFLLVSLVSYWDDIQKNIKGFGSLAMTEPYKAVVKNHLIIISLGFLSAFDVSEYTLYFLLVFYFFPYEEVLKSWKHKKANDN